MSKDNFRRDLHSILKDNRYYIPTLQRNYEWENKHIEELWGDLFGDDFWVKHDNIEPHFMGTLVTCPSNREDENTDNKENLDILDGQQRLTTLSIFLTECYIRMSQHKKEEDEYETIGAVKGCLKLNKRKSQDNKTQFRLNLQKSLDKVILEHLISELPDRAPTDLQTLRTKFQRNFKNIKIGKNKLLNCITRTRELMDKIISDAESTDLQLGERLESIADRLLYTTDFLVINTSSTTSAYKIFESLNDRGVDLSQADLIKNKLCSFLDDSEIEDFGESWGSIKEHVGAETNGMVNYLRSYVISTHGSVTKRELLDKFEGEIGTNPKSGYTTKQKRKKVHELIKDLSEHALKYSMLTSPEDVSPDNCDAWRGKVSFLNKLQAKTCRHALLSALMNNYKELEQLVDIITLVQLRNVIIDGNPNKAEKTHCEVAKLIGQKNGDVPIKTIQEMYLPLIGTNEVFFEKFMQTDATSIPVWRYILEQIHNLNPITEMEISDTSKVHVEHILAQKATEDSIKESRLSGNEELKRYVHKAGNLTLLDKKLNIKAQNDKFSIKNSEFYKDSRIPMNDYFKNLDKWTKEDIEKRTSELCQDVSKIWKHPKEGAISDTQINKLFQAHKEKLKSDENIEYTN